MTSRSCCGRAEGAGHRALWSGVLRTCESDSADPAAQQCGHSMHAVHGVSWVVANVAGDAGSHLQYSDRNMPSDPNFFLLRGSSAVISKADHIEDVLGPRIQCLGVHLQSFEGIHFYLREWGHCRMMRAYRCEADQAVEGGHHLRQVCNSHLSGQEVPCGAAGCEGTCR